MSCSFWLRRKKYVAQQQEQERLKAEASKETAKTEAKKQVKETEAKVFGEEPAVTVRKPRKKAVESNDNA